MMKHALARYDDYKDSGVEWIGEVPEHWEIKRVKDELENLDYKRMPLSGEVRGQMTEPVFDYYGASGVIDKVESYIFDEPLILIGEDGANLLMRNSPLAFIARGKYWVNNHAHILGPKKGLLHFLCYLLEAFDYTILISGSAQPKLTAGNLNSVLLMIPPISEQKAIANYLDTKTVQIDRKIDLLTQKATQYGKLKQSLINETVTRGLDKTVSMKDSGVDWLGDVPEHWKVNRLKNLAYIKTGGKDTIDNVEEGAYPFFVRSQTIERINSYSFDGEAILTAGDGVGVGKVFHHVNCKFDYHQRVYKISNFRRVVGKFVFYYMRENFHKDALRLNAKSTVDSLRMPMFQNFTIAFGDIEEQQAIVDYLDTKTVHIDRIVETINTQIDKLKELRKTLINDVVTGKIKVV